MLRIILILFLGILVASQYKVVDTVEGSSFIKLSLQYTGTSDYYIKPKSKIIKDLVFYFQALTYSDFTFKIYDPNNQRFQALQGGIFPFDYEASFTFPLIFANYKINYTTQHFGFNIVRKSTDAILFDSSVVQIEFSEYFIQIGTIVDSKIQFGFSERFTPHFKVKPGTWTIFNRDRGQMLDQGSGLQTHGFYPAYMVRQRSGLHHMGYFRTTNAVDVEVESFSNTSYLNIYRTIGGIIDFRFYLSESNPQDMILKFHNFIGSSAIPPFWSLGFHQCRWGYKNISYLENVLAKFQENDIPIDSIWSDIDYMHEYETFTVDSQRFPLTRMREITKNYHYVPIVEPSIRLREGYAYNEGKIMNVFIKDAQGNDQIGEVWAGPVVFPDFFHPNVTLYWTDMLNYLYSQVQFSGVWLDMNQISNMCNGPCTPPTGETVIDYSKDIPYQPGSDNIETQAIPLNATHFGNKLQANVHAYFGFMETQATYKFLKPRGRPFILTRSSTFGSNRYASHWTGDNYSNFTYLRLSISSNFMFGLWGIQMVGSDICGFGGNATAQLCARWFQLGSLYPFSRNHNEFDSIDQQPYALGPVVLQSSKKNIKLKYSLLKYYYSLFILSKGKGTIFRPLYFEFPDDANVIDHDDILQTQFLLGKGLMCTPIVQEGKIQRTAYFPSDIWYNFYTGELQPQRSIGIVTNKLTDYVPLYIRNGYLIFKQNITNITKSKQLGREFVSVGGFKFKSSNSSHIQYVSKGTLLALGDYQNSDDIDKCIVEDCNYAITATLIANKTSKQRQLFVDIVYSGKSIKYSQKIIGFTIYTETEVLELPPGSEVDVDGTKSVSFKFEQK